MGSARERFLGFFHRVNAGALQGFLGFRKGAVKGQPIIPGDFVSVILDGLFRRIHEPVQLIFRVDLLAALFVFVRELLRLLHEFIDVVLGELAGRGDPDGLLLVGSQVLGRHMQDPVGVQIERHLDLRDAARRGRNPVQKELAQGHIVLRHRAFALQHVDFHGGLAVGRGGEDLRLLHRDGRIPVDQGRPHPAHRLDAERQRRHVQEKTFFTSRSTPRPGRRRPAPRIPWDRCRVPLSCRRNPRRTSARSACASGRRP